MNAHRFPLSFICCSLVTLGCVSAKTSDSGEVRLSNSLTPAPTVSPSPTVAPCEPEMSKVKRNTAPKPVGGPISGEASATAESRPVRDLPAATTCQQQEPREINHQNTIPIKTTGASAIPCTDAALSHPPEKKRKLSRPKKHR